MGRILYPPLKLKCVSSVVHRHLSTRVLKRMDGQMALPWKAGPVPLPPLKCLNHNNGDVAISTAALYLVCETLLPWENERQVLPTP